MAEKTETSIVRFRTVWGGFHKRDVTEYLVKTHASHREALERLNERIAQLEEENEKLRAAAGEPERLGALEAENSRLAEQLAQANAALEEKEARCLREQELEAYRRAEAMERRATQRFRKASAQVEAVRADVTGQMAVALGSAKEALSAIEGQLTTLQATSVQLDAAMSGGAEKLEVLASAFSDAADEE